MVALYTPYLLVNGLPNLRIFYPKTICTPRGIIPQNFSSLGLAVSEESGNKQRTDINKYTHTDIQIHTLRHTITLRGRMTLSFVMSPVQYVFTIHLIILT